MSGEILLYEIKNELISRVYSFNDIRCYVKENNDEIVYRG